MEYVKLHYWNHDATIGNVWRVDRSADGTMDVTNVGDWSGLRHKNVPIADTAPIDVATARDLIGAEETKRSAEEEATRIRQGIGQQLTPDAAGCWIDGHWGQYAIAHLVERAAEVGYADAEVIGLAERHLASIGPSTSEGITDEEYEILSDAADEVEQWLNEQCAPDGYSFGWSDGEFFLWSSEQWAIDL